jgi:GDP/UDP-N,N'-diacetylbacillosamine 2-epimerase (hydrolysing)
LRKILYISGTRADYGPARRLLLDLNNDPDFDLGILVMGMHLDPIHGETWREIEKDGLNIVDKIYGRLSGDSLASMAGSIGLYLFGISVAIEKHTPDIVLVLGDRGEQLAGAMAAAYQNKVVVHLCGGTLSGSIDDTIRHAITKFSHYHFPPFDSAKNRIIQLGENPQNIFQFGLPGGNLSRDVKFSKPEILKMLNFDKTQPYLLVIQHSVTHSQPDVENQIIETLEAFTGKQYNVLLANANDDAGGKIINIKMKEYSDKYSNFRILEPPQSRELFASIMAHAEVLVGNSSSGIVEAMSVKTPVVNIGDRQKGRENLGFLISSNYDRRQISQAIDKALGDEKFTAEFRLFISSNFENDTETLICNKLKSISLDIGNKGKIFFNLIT